VRWACLIFGLFLLLGCASEGPLGPVSNPQTAWKMHQHELKQIQEFSLDADLGIIQEGSGESLGVHWEHTPDQDVFIFSGPLGMDLGELKENASGVVLKDSQGVFRAQTPELLLQEVFGWSLPVEGLRNWILGLPDESSSEEMSLNDSGYLKNLDTQAWQIQYLSYLPYGSYALPQKIRLTQGDLRVLIFIRNWQANRIDL